MASKDYYEILGVSKDADKKTIKRAFLKLARELHPDVSDEPDAEERFKEVNEAYSVLSDDQRRANYDRFGDPDGPGGFGGGSGYVDFSDIFGGGMEDIFSSFFGGGRASGGRPARTEGRDMGLSLRITLAEAAAGCTKTIAYDRLAPCDDCDGKGTAEGGSVTTCPTCHGSGHVTTVQRTILGQMQATVPCPDCNGAGQSVDKPCETCDGQGRTPNHEKVEIKIPAGIRSGQAVRIRDMGEAGMRGASSGDLIVTVEVADDETFERAGDDLYCRVEVDALDAIVGTSVELDGILDGDKVKVDVPAGCAYGQRITVSGMGMPRMGGSGRGSLVAVVDVVVPSDLSEQDMDTIREIASRRGRDGM